MRPIDADELKKDLTRFYDNEVTAKQLIDEQPTIEPEQRWIPCSVKLPEESRKYLVTVLDGIGKRTTSAPYHRRSKSWTLTGRMAYWKVVAWMPLPEPCEDAVRREDVQAIVEKSDWFESSDSFNDFMWALYDLPSAQPEQHTCVNCGRTVNNGGWYADGRTRCPIEEHYALPKNGYCHLWEKRNVTDDDYPERRTDE